MPIAEQVSDGSEKMSAMADQPDDTTARDSSGNADEDPQVGRPSPTSKQDLLDALDDVLATTGGPIATTSEVAERVEIKERTVRMKLSELADDGRVATRKIGSGRVWWPIEPDDQGTEDPDK